jgi:transposase
MVTGLKPQSMVIADRGYDADRIRTLVNQQGAWANTPPKQIRKCPICFSLHCIVRATW